MNNIVGFLCPKCGWQYSPERGYRVPRHRNHRTSVGKFLSDVMGVKQSKAKACPGSGGEAIVEGPQHDAN